MNHTDEKGRSASARSRVAKQMRTIVRGRRATKLGNVAKGTLKLRRFQKQTGRMP
jgi:hypothetical protein